MKLTSGYSDTWQQDRVAGRSKYSFREIKQLLHIKSFIGTSENAVVIQLWTALITILILKALKAMAKHRWYLSNLVGFIRLNLFVKIDQQIIPLIKTSARLTELCRGAFLNQKKSVDNKP